MPRAKKPKIAVGETWRTRSGHQFRLTRYVESIDAFMGVSVKRPDVIWTFTPQGTTYHARSDAHDLVKKL